MATTLPTNLRIRDEIAGESAEGGFYDEHRAQARAMKELSDDGPHDLARENRRDERDGNPTLRGPVQASIHSRVVGRERVRH